MNGNIVTSLKLIAIIGIVGISLFLAGIRIDNSIKNAQYTPRPAGPTVSEEQQRLDLTKLNSPLLTDFSSVAGQTTINPESSYGTATTEYCDFQYSGRVEVPLGQCSQMTDCEIDHGKFQAVFISDCDALHAKQAKTLTATPVHTSIYSSTPLPSFSPVPFRKPAQVETVTCVLSYGTYQLTKEYCESSQKQDEQRKYEQELKLKHQEACNRAVADWSRFKEAFMRDSASKYSSSGEAMIVLSGYKNQFQKELDDAGCNRKIYL